MLQSKSNHGNFRKRLGVTAVVANNKVIGIITDGDIRRMLNDRDQFTDLVAQDIMTKP